MTTLSTATPASLGEPRQFVPASAQQHTEARRRGTGSVGGVGGDIDGGAVSGHEMGGEQKRESEGASADGESRVGKRTRVEGR